MSMALQEVARSGNLDAWKELGGPALAVLYRKGLVGFKTAKVMVLTDKGLEALEGETAGE